MRRSEINPEYEFDRDHWVVSFVNKESSSMRFIGGHAVLVIEGLNADGSLYKAFADMFGAADNENGIRNDSLPGVFSNETGVHFVRYKDTNDVTLDCYKSCPQKWSWRLPRVDVEQMIAHIVAERDATDEKKGGRVRPYNSAGQASLLGSGDHNCASLCLSFLEVAGIDAHSIWDKFKVTPDRNHTAIKTGVGITSVLTAAAAAFGGAMLFSSLPAKRKPEEQVVTDDSEERKDKKQKTENEEGKRQEGPEQQVTMSSENSQGILSNPSRGALYKQGKAHLDRGKYQEASEFFNRLITLYHSSRSEIKKEKLRTAYYMLGRAQQGLEKYEQAIASFQKAIELDEEIVKNGGESQPGCRDRLEECRAVFTLNAENFVQSVFN